MEQGESCYPSVLPFCAYHVKSDWFTIHWACSLYYHCAKCIKVHTIIFMFYRASEGVS